MDSRDSRIELISEGYVSLVLEVFVGTSSTIGNVICERNFWLVSVVLI